jgi:ppGpp synthetase/RelA/SpoT-type nucleotidyltranferase
MGQREYPRFDYGVEDVKRVSAVIAGDLHWTSETKAQIREAFQIANNWRDAHAFPMRSVRCSLRWYIHHHDIAGVTAARLKRMQAIRRKLARPGLRPLDLHLMQDLGGCRVIVSSIADVRRLVDLMRSGRHTVHHESPHIDKPTKDGYRSHHMILEYCGRGARKIYDGKRVEVQVRTRMLDAALELLMQPLDSVGSTDGFPLVVGKAQESEELVGGLLETIGDRAAG